VKFLATKKGLTTNFFSALYFIAVFGSGIRDPGSEIRDPEWVKIKIRIRDTDARLCIFCCSEKFDDKVWWRGSWSAWIHISLASLDPDKWYVTTKWGKEENGRELYGAFSECGPLTENSVTKLKSGQLNVCTVYCVLYVQCTLFPPAAEICAGLAGNFVIS
jgi:hypothetical protein